MTKLDHLEGEQRKEKMLEWAERVRDFETRKHNGNQDDISEAVESGIKALYRELTGDEWGLNPEDILSEEAYRKQASLAKENATDMDVGDYDEEVLRTFRNGLTRSNETVTGYLSRMGVI